ncbi:hypothetical protein HK104_005440, partial [Borealophlyctis nickersoniae]
MYHSVCQRHLKQKKVEDALELLHQGAKNMLAHDQVGSGTDLAQRLLDIYESEKMPVNDATRGRLLDLFQSFPVRTQACDDYVRSCLRWSSKFGTCPTGDPQMHHAFGSRYFKEKQYYDAEAHFVYGTLDSAKALGHMDWECEFCETPYYAKGEGTKKEPPGANTEAFPSSPQPRYLALKKIQHASITFETFTKHLKSETPDAKGIPLPFNPSSSGGDPTPEVSLYKSPFINFVQFLILCVQRDASDLFVNLRTQYRAVVASDSFLEQMVEVVADVFFDLGPKKPVNPFE